MGDDTTGVCADTWWWTEIPLHVAKKSGELVWTDLTPSQRTVWVEFCCVDSLGQGTKTEVPLTWQLAVIGEDVPANGKPAHLIQQGEKMVFSARKSTCQVQGITRDLVRAEIWGDDGICHEGPYAESQDDMPNVVHQFNAEGRNWEVESGFACIENREPIPDTHYATKVHVIKQLKVKAIRGYSRKPQGVFEWFEFMIDATSGWSFFLPPGSQYALLRVPDEGHRTWWADYAVDDGQRIPYLWWLSLVSGGSEFWWSPRLYTLGCNKVVVSVTYDAATLEHESYMGKGSIVLMANSNNDAEGTVDVVDNVNALGQGLPARPENGDLLCGYAKEESAVWFVHAHNMNRLDMYAEPWWNGNRQVPRNAAKQTAFLNSRDSYWALKLFAQRNVGGAQNPATLTYYAWDDDGYEAFDPPLLGNCADDKRIGKEAVEGSIRPLDSAAYPFGVWWTRPPGASNGAQWAVPLDAVPRELGDYKITLAPNNWGGIQAKFADLAGVAAPSATLPVKVIVPGAYIIGDTDGDGDVDSPLDVYLYDRTAPKTAYDAHWNEWKWPPKEYKSWPPVPDAYKSTHEPDSRPSPPPAPPERDVQDRACITLTIPRGQNPKLPRAEIKIYWGARSKQTVELSFRPWPLCPATHAGNPDVAVPIKVYGQADAEQPLTEQQLAQLELDVGETKRVWLEPQAVGAAMIELKKGGELGANLPIVAKSDDEAIDGQPFKGTIVCQWWYCTGAADPLKLHVFGFVFDKELGPQGKPSLPATVDVVAGPISTPTGDKADPFLVNAKLETCTTRIVDDNGTAITCLYAGVFDAVYVWDEDSGLPGGDHKLPSVKVAAQAVGESAPVNFYPPGTYDPGHAARGVIGSSNQGIYARFYRTEREHGRGRKWHDPSYFPEVYGCNDDELRAWLKERLDKRIQDAAAAEGTDLLRKWLEQFIPEAP